MSTAAIALLHEAAKTCDSNADIQRNEGRHDEADQNVENANNYRDALIILELEHAQQRYHQRYSPALSNVTINN
jgi:hypothetical protein